MLQARLAASKDISSIAGLISYQSQLAAVASFANRPGSHPHRTYFSLTEIGKPLVRPVRLEEVRPFQE
jgi:hypothetical protein